MEVMTSEKGKTLYLIDGFKFRFHKRLSKLNQRWVCSTKFCKSFMILNDSREVLRKPSIHNHEKPNERILKRQRLSNSLKCKATEDIITQPSKLIHQALLGDNTSVTPEDITLVRRTIHRARSKLHPLQKSMGGSHGVFGDIGLTEDFNSRKMLQSIEAKSSGSNNISYTMSDQDLTLSQQFLRDSKDHSTQGTESDFVEVIIKEEFSPRGDQDSFPVSVSINDDYTSPLFCNNTQSTSVTKLLTSTSNSCTTSIAALSNFVTSTGHDCSLVDKPGDDILSRTSQFDSSNQSKGWDSVQTQSGIMEQFNMKHERNSHVDSDLVTKACDIPQPSITLNKKLNLKLEDRTLTMNTDKNLSSRNLSDICLSSEFPPFEDYNNYSFNGDIIKDEFFTFAMNIASQLRQLPIERALRTQVKLQSVLAEERIAAMLE